MKQLLEKYPEFHLHRTTMPGGMLSEEGRTQLRNRLAIDGYPWPGDEDFDYTWITNRGTLPKRLSNHYHKLGKNLTSTQLAAIGNIGRQHTAVEEEVYFDFVTRINWRAGEFGDDGSCYWGGREQARDMITEHDGGGIRLWKPHVTDSLQIQLEMNLFPLKADQRRLEHRHYGPNYTGMARCWLLPHEKGVIAFNGYGRDTLWFAHFLAHLQGSSYRKVALTNKAVTDGTLYINSGRGFLIGETQEIRSILRYDFDINDPYENEEDDYPYHCQNCGDGIQEDDAFFVDDHPYCSECSFFCDCCDEVYRNARYFDGKGHLDPDGMVRHHTPNGSFCLNCIDNYGFFCPSCQHWTADGNRWYHDPAHQRICRNCYHFHGGTQVTELEHTNSLLTLAGEV